MKLMKKLLIASAIGMAFAGQAQALTTGTGVNNGSLFLAVWDNSAAGTYSYVQDLGQTIDSFLPTGATANGDLSFNTSFLSSFTGLDSDLRWNVVAYDSSSASIPFNPRRAAVSTQIGTVNAGGVTTAGLTTVTSNIGTAATTIGAGCADALVGCSSTSTLLKGATYGNTLGYPGLSTSQSLDASLEMMYLAAVGTNAQTAASVDFYDNAYGRAVWSLSSNGQLTYTVGAEVAAVPVPAALWLFGSGLLGLVGIGRRKSVVAA